MDKRLIPKGRPFNPRKQLLLDKFKQLGVDFGRGMKCHISQAQLERLDKLIPERDEVERAADLLATFAGAMQSFCDRGHVRKDVAAGFIKAAHKSIKELKC